jgi:CheY-like chemotaxis protein/HPt (histidine-containing phosphotransfer) domain-containing protein
MRKQMEDELKIATQKAEESSMLKEAFLANMSHEIRTPMNAIIGFADLLSKSELDDKEREYVEAITIAGDNLLIIINDILDLSKIESGMMTFESKAFSVKETFKSLYLMLKAKAEEKNIKLSFTCDENVPDVLLGDATRLNQIITNLAGNAIKFTHKGSVQVYAKVLKIVNEITSIEFSIIDTGIGIPEDKMEKIFERFRQAESNITREYGGTGLGLSIAKQLVELQGGTLSVKSECNVGSVFSFNIPYRKSSQVLVASEVTVKKYDVDDLSKLNILLVENNQLNIKLILNLFSKYNLKLEIAENGSECIEKLKENSFDIILMDMEMPVMNGYEATTIIRTEMKNNIPIIAMTAHAIAGERERCLKMGMNDYISKPINANLLFEKIYNLTIDTNIKIIDKSDESKEFIESKESVCDFRYLSETMNGEKHSIKEIMDVFLEQIHEELLGINDAVAKTDYSIIKNYAHTMKSTVSIMGISILAPVLKEMENMSASAKDIEKIKELNKNLNLICNQAIQEIEIEKLNYV